jgi:hypothetical protein
MLNFIANPLEDERRRDFSLPGEPFVMEEVVSDNTDHSISIIPNRIVKAGPSVEVLPNGSV